MRASKNRREKVRKGEELQIMQVSIRLDTPGVMPEIF
jgi:hypothetical protein